MAESCWWVYNVIISILLKEGWYFYEYPWNETDIRFVWLSSLYNPFNSFGERSIAKKYCPVSLLSVICKILEKLLNYELFNDSEKCVLFFYLQCCFRSSWSTADLLTNVSGRTDRIFSKSGVTWAVALDVCKAFDRVWHTSPLHKQKSYEISLKLFGHIKYFLKNKWLLFSFWMGSLAKCIQLILEFLKALFLVLHYSYYI